MLKSEIRKQAILRRNELTSENFNSLNLQLLEQFKTIDFSNTHVIHVFIPIEEKREPDTFLMINWLKETHPRIKILVPRADFTNLLMTHHEYNGAENLVKNIFNILEPQATDTYRGPIDMVFIPLLAFDHHGYRVGYGKGFYDRFLPEYKIGQKIGISLFSSVNSIIDSDTYDIRLDRCITPEKTVIF